MGVIGVGDVYTVKMVGLLYGSTIIYDFAYKIRSMTGPPLDDLVFQGQLNSFFQSSASLPWLQIINAECPEYTAQYSQVQRLWPNRLPYDRLVTPTAGLFAGTAATPTNSAVITKRVNPPVQGGVGHLCLSGLDVATIVNGRWTGSAITSMTTIGTAVAASPVISGGSNSTTLDPVVYKRLDPANSGLIFACTLADEVRTQKRRVVGRGI